MPLLASPRRLIVLFLASTSLSLNPGNHAIAQPAAQGTQDVAGQPDADPPAVAGSLASMAGSVSFHANGETQWSPATLNYPVTAGEGFWTEPQASATLDIADSRVVLDESTELDVATLDQTQVVLTEPQGALFIDLTTMAQGQTLTVNTPRGAVLITQAGRYEIVAGDTNDATTISVVAGAAHITGTNLALDVGPQQTATITGADQLQGGVGPLQVDAFLKTQLQTIQQVSAVPPQCRGMTGARSLASYGSFQQSAEYGQVWYPNNVSTSWAPYRDGHWSYVSPWGWTWVDNAPWGFAPFHYGRWAEIHSRWAWIPGGGDVTASAYGPAAYPIYSPALVTFVGLGAGVGIGVSVGSLGGGYAPAWIPLGPREPYYPWYHFRPGYFARINSFYGVPPTIIERGPTYINTVNINQTNIFVNRRYATVVNAEAFARGQSLVGIARPVPEHAWAQAHAFGDRLPVRPTAMTPNLPPEAARRFNVALPPRPMHVAAGPVIQPRAAGLRAFPELRHDHLPQNIRAEPARPGMPANPPGQARETSPHPDRIGAQPGQVLPHPSGTPPTPSERPELRPSRSEPASHPKVGTPKAGELPTIRAPGARPETLGRPEMPGSARELKRPGTVPTPPGTLAPASRPPESRVPESRAQDRNPSHGTADHLPLPRSNAPHTETRQAPVPLPREEPRSTNPTRPPERAARHPETPAPAPHPSVPRPAPHAEPMRPPPRAETPRPAPHAEMAHPQPHPEAHGPAPHPERKPPPRK